MPINSRFSFVASDEEISEIAAKAAAEGMSSSAWARMKMEMAPPRPQGRTKKELDVAPYPDAPIPAPPWKP